MDSQLHRAGMVVMGLGLAMTVYGDVNKQGYYKSGLLTVAGLSICCGIAGQILVLLK